MNEFLGTLHVVRYFNVCLQQDTKQCCYFTMLICIIVMSTASTMTTVSFLVSQNCLINVYCLLGQTNMKGTGYFHILEFYHDLKRKGSSQWYSRQMEL